MWGQKEKVQRGAQWLKGWHYPWVPTGASATKTAHPCLTSTTCWSQHLGHALKSHLLNEGLQGKPDLWDRDTAESHLSSLEELEPFGMSALALASKKFSTLQLMGHGCHSCYYTEAQLQGWKHHDHLLDWRQVSRMLGFSLEISLADMIFPFSLCHHLDFCFHIAVAGHAGDALSALELEKPAALQKLPTELKEAPKALIFSPIPLHLIGPFPQPHTPKAKPQQDL